MNDFSLHCCQNYWPRVKEDHLLKVFGDFYDIEVVNKTTNATSIAIVPNKVTP